MPKLTDTQLVILSAAARRKDGTVLPLPRSLKVNKAAATTVLKTLREIVNEFAKEKGFTIVFRKAQFLFVSPQFEVTQEIIKRLDAKLPTVKVELPSE